MEGGDSVVAETSRHDRIRLEQARANACGSVYRGVATEPVEAELDGG